jgi:hypothetical protein
MFILPVPQAKDTIFKILKPNLLFFHLVQAFKNKLKALRMVVFRNISTILTSTNLSEPFVKSCSIISWFSVPIPAQDEYG